MNINHFQNVFFNPQINRIQDSSFPKQIVENSFFDEFLQFNQNHNNHSFNQDIEILYENCSQAPKQFIEGLDLKPSEISHQYFQRPNPWVKSLNQLGWQESSFESDEIQIPSTTAQQIESISKTKLIKRYKSCVEMPQDSKQTDPKVQAKKFQNETKNLPKNFGKAIIAFALKRFKDFSHLPQFRQIKYEDFKKELILKRQSMNTISGLKSVWIDFKYSRCMRLLSNRFLRRHSLSYIFNSKISNISPHVKYRFRLLEAIQSPRQFTSIKDS